MKRCTYCLCCTCGAIWKGEDTPAPPDVFERLRASFEAIHNGPGHAPCTEAEAQAAQDREMYGPAGNPFENG